MSSDPEHKAKDLGSVITKLAPYVLSAGLSVGGFYIGAKFDPIYKALEVSESRAIELGKDFRDFVRLREIDRTEAAQARADRYPSWVPVCVVFPPARVRADIGRLSVRHGSCTTTSRFPGSIPACRSSSSLSPS